ncbi:MAG: pyridoxal phosphate-dependent aminotransferase [Caldilineaceae bacterium]|nr:pyridoxal phosphate-dependent aminotransferase [Caldilineaceae bacterium]
MSQPAVVPFELTPAISRSLRPSPTLYLNERVNQMWADGETVYHLGFGESRFPVHPKIQAALRANVHQKSYLAGQGLAELRGAAADFYSRHMDATITPAQVIIGPGSKSIIYATQMALDADLILPTPSWVSYAPQADLLGKPVYHVPSSSDDFYDLDMEALDATVRRSQGRNKMLLITSPNNPTGLMLRPDFLRELADYCRAQGIVVVSDEIYALVPHAHAEHVSISRYYPEGTVVLGGLSKHLSLGGWRVGVGIVPAHEAAARLMMALRVVAGEIWSTPTGPVQYAAITAFSGDPEIEAYIAECRDLHEIRTQYIWRELTAQGYRIKQPDGAFYMLPILNGQRDALARLGVSTSTELAAYLLDNYQIAALPGTAFSAPEAELCLRLASSYLDMETDAKADEILAAYRSGVDADTLMRDHHPATNAALARFGDFMAALG